MKKPYTLVIHLPMDHGSDEEAQDHAKLALKLLEPLKSNRRWPHLPDLRYRASLYAMEDNQPPRHVEWEKTP